jgi:hypothetical protein
MKNGSGGGRRERGSPCLGWTMARRRSVSDNPREDRRGIVLTPDRPVSVGNRRGVRRISYPDGNSGRNHRYQKRKAGNCPYGRFSVSQSEHVVAEPD